MVKAGNFGGVRKGSIGMIRFIMEKLQTSLSPSKGLREGHFVVIATKDWEPKRFFIKLSYLSNPEFLKLLKQAEDEFGFSHEGALEIPCQPEELQRILSSQYKKIVKDSY